MRVLVLGGYGLIGAEIVRAALRETAPHKIVEIVALGRSTNKGERLVPGVRWIGLDLATATRPEDWLEHLDGIDAIVNASGALQSGALDNLGAVQRDAICALISACEQSGVGTFVQISAPGAESGVGSKTEFLRTKGQADQALRESKLDWVILKPGLVISRTAYGGTSLLRMLAAFPMVQPIVMGDVPVQTVSVEAVAEAVLHCVREATLPGDGLADWEMEHGSLGGQEFDLIEPEARSLEETVATFRAWLGFSNAIFILRLPQWLGRGIAKLADIAGYLGWRSPLRSTAFNVLATGVVGNPEPWRLATGQTLRSLPETLKEMPATLQERVYARVALLFPLLVCMLSGFWIVSGVIGLLQYRDAALFVSEQLGSSLALGLVIVGGLLDILIGVGLLFRGWLRASCIASIALAGGYMLAGSILAPGLWADPLGALVKIGPVIGLALAVSAMAEER